MDMMEHDSAIMPGFRFHPTDEELVSFYLFKKAHCQAVAAELISELDIYKYDPWDLSKMATIGDKEWYFFSPRDKKYRNSSRPNRVTKAGFWKATGTDRPVHSLQAGSTKCIGLKKSLVFYKGNSARGVKTDWMMHEFRLQNTGEYIGQELALCKIFKKNKSTSEISGQAKKPNCKS